MVTLLGALIGFLGAIFPEAIKIWRDGEDRKHELAIMDRQMDMQKQGHSQRLEAIGVAADIAETQSLYKTFYSGIDWVDALNGTVRPVLAYAFFLLYAYVKFKQAIHTPWAIWDDDDKAIFAGIISFYYGNRALQKYGKRA